MASRQRATGANDRIDASGGGEDHRSENSRNEFCHPFRRPAVTVLDGVGRSEETMGRIKIREVVMLDGVADNNPTQEDGWMPRRGKRGGAMLA